MWRKMKSDEKSKERNKMYPRDDYTSGPLLIGVMGLLGGMGFFSTIVAAVDGHVVSAGVLALLSALCYFIIGALTMLELEI
jgi:hypothetical protein